jgi:hypothetical protein
MRRLGFLLSLILLTETALFSVEVGKVTDFKGRVDLVKKDHLRGTPLRAKDSPLEVGDLLRTKYNGYARVEFIDGTKVEVFENSRLKIIDLVGERDVNIQRGIVRFEVRSAKGLKGFKIRTPHAIIGVKGTRFWVSVLPGITRVVVTRGRVTVIYKNSALKHKPERTAVKLEERNHQSKDPYSNRKPPLTTINVEVILQ